MANKIIRIFFFTLFFTIFFLGFAIAEDRIKSFYIPNELLKTEKITLVQNYSLICTKSFVDDPNWFPFYIEKDIDKFLTSSNFPNICRKFVASYRPLQEYLEKVRKNKIENQDINSFDYFLNKDVELFVAYQKGIDCLGEGYKLYEKEYKDVLTKFNLKMITVCYEKKIEVIDQKSTDAIEKIISLGANDV